MRRICNEKESLISSPTPCNRSHQKRKIHFKNIFHEETESKIFHWQTSIAIFQPDKFEFHSVFQLDEAIIRFIDSNLLRTLAVYRQSGSTMMIKKIQRLNVGLTHILQIYNK